MRPGSAACPRAQLSPTDILEVSARVLVIQRLAMYGGRLTTLATLPCPLDGSEARMLLIFVPRYRYDEARARQSGSELAVMRRHWSMGSSRTRPIGSLDDGPRPHLTSGQRTRLWSEKSPAAASQT